MSRVITFSRFFSSYHPRKGEPTWFVEKIWNGFRDESWAMPKEYTPFISDYMALSDNIYYLMAMRQKGIKGHTIRAGNRWKVGDKFSPRVWSGKPYNSKQLTIAPDITITGVTQFEVRSDRVMIDTCDFGLFDESNPDMIDVAKNDGLEVNDFLSWFNKDMVGQIICWNPEINY